MNVIDDAKLQAAAQGVTDHALQGVTTQILPVLTSLVDATVSKLCLELETVVGDTLKDLTFERQETINDLHGLLDRLEGLSLTIHIPARKGTN